MRLFEFEIWNSYERKWETHRVIAEDLVAAIIHVRKYDKKREVRNVKDVGACEVVHAE